MKFIINRDAINKRFYDPSLAFAFTNTNAIDMKTSTTMRVETSPTQH